MKGFSYGVLKGLAGCVVKPTAGAMDLIHQTFMGIKNTAGYIDGTHGIITRARMPRFFPGDGVLCWFSQREAEGFAFVVLLGKQDSESYLYHINLRGRNEETSSAKRQILLVTDAYVRTVEFKLKRGNKSMRILQDDKLCLHPQEPQGGHGLSGLTRGARTSVRNGMNGSLA